MSKGSGTTRSGSKSNPRGLTATERSIISATERVFSSPVLSTPPAPPAGPTPLEEALANTKTKRLEYEDDIVRVFDDKGNEAYRGLEDYDPNKDLDWRYDPSTGVYKYRGWTKLVMA